MLHRNYSTKLIKNTYDDNMLEIVCVGLAKVHPDGLQREPISPCPLLDHNRGLQILHQGRHVVVTGWGTVTGTCAGTRWVNRLVPKLSWNMVYIQIEAVSIQCSMFMYSHSLFFKTIKNLIYKLHQLHLSFSWNFFSLDCQEFFNC